MEAKKLAPVRKVVSGFHLCIGVSIIVFTVMLLDCSLQTPIINPMFQGFTGTTVGNNSSIKSWSFSFSKSSPVLGSVSTVSTNVSSNLRNYEDLNRTRVSNMSNTSAAIEDFFTPNRTGVVLKDTHLMGNFSVKEGISGISRDGNGNVVLNIAHDSEVVMEKTHLGNLSDVVKDEIIVKVPKVSTTVTTEVISFEGQSVGEERNASSIIDGKIRAAQKVGKISYESCDLFDGRWVKDDTKPYYPAGSCPYVDRDFDCHLNGRPDDGFLKWRWQPNGCDMPSMNASDFLERLRGKKLVFVGDSLNRNMWESLVCILHHSIKDKKRVYEISGKKEFKKKGFYAFIFEDYNCTVDFVSAPFLVRESLHKSRNGTVETLRLDLMDQTTSMYHDADVIIFNSGHWWTHEKTSKGEDYYQEGNYVHPRLKVLIAYKKALTTWAKWVDKNIDSERTQVIFRGYSVTHFRGGPWNSGGQCNKEVDPIFNETYLSKYPSKMRALQTVLEKMKTPITYLNISRLTDYRKDGHPSIYRTEYKTTAERASAEHTQDCSHWCLPGVPDTWNELLYASLLKAGKGSWRR